MSVEDFEAAENTAPTEQAPKPKKVFTRNDIKRYLDISVVLPKLYPDFEPWEFKLRLKLSGEAEDRRQEYLTLSAAKQTERSFEQCLDEMCDLLIDFPKGFADLKTDTGLAPGVAFKDYVDNTKDADAKQTLMLIVEGANVLYWRHVMPHEFRPKV